MTRGVKREFISRSYNHLLRVALHARMNKTTFTRTASRLLRRVAYICPTRTSTA